MRAAMRRRHIDRHREAARRLSCVELDDAPELRCREGEDPSLRAEQAEILAAIRALPEIHRDVLVTTYVAGLTYTEAADALGCKRGTIMSRVYRAREALMKSLEGERSRRNGVNSAPSAAGPAPPARTMRWRCARSAANVDRPRSPPPLPTFASRDVVTSTDADAATAPSDVDRRIAAIAGSRTGWSRATTCSRSRLSGRDRRPRPRRRLHIGSVASTRSATPPLTARPPPRRAARVGPRAALSHRHRAHTAGRSPRRAGRRVTSSSPAARRVRGRESASTHDARAFVTRPTTGLP